MKIRKSKKAVSAGTLTRYLPAVLMAVALALLLTTALAHLSARHADERNRKIVEAGLHLHLTLQRLTATLDPEYDPAKADFGALAQASHRFAGSLETLERDLVVGAGAEELPRRLRDSIQRITEKQRSIDALAQQAEKLGTVKKTLETTSDLFGALVVESARLVEGYEPLARSVSQLNPKSLPRTQADALGAAYATADTGLREAVEKLKAAPGNPELVAATRKAAEPVVAAAKAIAQKNAEFPATKDAQTLVRQFTAMAEATERVISGGEGGNATAPAVDHDRIRAELRRARGELLVIGQQLPVINEYFERFLERPPVASLTEVLFVVSALMAAVALVFGWRAAGKAPVAEPAAAPALADNPWAREPAMAEPLGGAEPLGSLGSLEPLGGANSEPVQPLWATQPMPSFATEETPAPAAVADDDLFAEAPAAEPAVAEPSADAVALRELLTDVDQRLADIASRAEEDSRHVEQLMAALGQSSQVVEQAARIQSEVADAAQALQARAAEMREALPAQGEMVRQVRESLINYAASAAPAQAASEILYALLDRLQGMERAAEGIDAQLEAGIGRLAKLPDGLGTLRTQAGSLLDGARQLEQVHDEAMIAVGGWRDEIVAIRARLAEAVHD